VFRSARVTPGLQLFNPRKSSCLVQILSPTEAGDDNARVLTDGLKSVPVTIDHEGVVSGKPRGSLGESARAVLIHRICARCGPGTYVAVLARIESEGNTASPVEGLRTNLGGRPHDGGNGAVTMYPVDV
jgi:hypothetical protein